MLTHLPVEIIELICRYIPLQYLGNIASTCKKLYRDHTILLQISKIVKLPEQFHMPMSLYTSSRSCMRVGLPCKSHAKEVTINEINRSDIVQFTDMLKWLRDDYLRCIRAMDIAANLGNLEMVKWFHVNHIECCSCTAMNCAAGRGYLDVVKFLHNNRTEGCTTDAMDWAAKNGHLDVVQWLHKNRKEGCTTNAMDNAAIGGHMNVVQFLHENRKEGCTTRAIDDATYMGRTHIFKWLHENRKEGYTQHTIDIALNYERKGILQYMTDHKMIYTRMSGRFGDHIYSMGTDRLFERVVPILVDTDCKRCELISGVLCRDVYPVKLYKGQHIAMYCHDMERVVISIPRDNSQVTTNWWNLVPCKVFTTSYKYIIWLLHETCYSDIN